MGRNMVNNTRKNPNTKPRRKKKIVLEFDEKKRREFLTGFRKRKQERKKKAREEIEQKLKEERKQIKLEVKQNILEQFKKSFQPIPELEELLEEKEYETEEVSVKIVELSTSELAKQNNWVGENKPIYSDDEDEVIESDNDEKEEIPGMSLTANKIPKEINQEKETEDGKTKENKLKSKRELNRIVQQQTMKCIQKSKAFKMKNQLDKSKNKKKARKEKNKKIKFLKQQSKKKGGKHVKLSKKSKKDVSK